MRFCHVTVLMTAAYAFAAAAPAADAQTLSIGAGVGVSVPRGRLGGERRTGRHVSGTLDLRRRPGGMGGVGYRAEVAFDHFPGRRGYEEFTVVSYLAYVSHALSDSSAELRLAVGGGAHAVRNIMRQQARAEGLAPGVGASLGMELRVRRVRVYAQAGAHVILSTVGLGEYSLPAYLPITIGVRF